MKKSPGTSTVKYSRDRKMCMKMSLLSHSLKPFLYLLFLSQSPKTFLEGVHKFKKLCHFIFKLMSCHESSCVKFQGLFLSRSSLLFSLTKKVYQLKMAGISISYSISSNLAISGQLANGGGGGQSLQLGTFISRPRDAQRKRQGVGGDFFRCFFLLATKHGLASSASCLHNYEKINFSSLSQLVHGSWKSQQTYIFFKAR